MSGLILAGLATDMNTSGVTLTMHLTVSVTLALLSWLWLTRPLTATLTSGAVTAAGVVTWSLLPLFPAALLALPVTCLLSWWLPRLPRRHAASTHSSLRAPLTS